MTSDRYLRHNIDRTPAAVAVERDVPDKNLSFDHHYLVMDSGRLLNRLATDGLVPIWAVSLYRELNSTDRKSVV